MAKAIQNTTIFLKCPQFQKRQKISDGKNVFGFISMASHWVLGRENIFFQTFSGRLNVCHTFVTDTWQQTLSCRQLYACNFLPDNLSYQCSRQQTFRVSPFSSRFSFCVTTLPVANVKHGCFQTVCYGSFLPDNRNSVMLSGVMESRSHAFQKITFQNQTKWAPVIKKPFYIVLRTPEVS